VTLKHAVAALLFVTMAAAPVTGIACVGWCVPGEIQTSFACDHTSTMLGIKGGENCDRVVAIPPFLKEETQPIVQAVLPANTPLRAFMSAAGVALLVYARDVDAAAARRATSPLVLRL
jgi:hypothetical protein